MPEYKRLNDTAWREFGSTLLKNKGSKRQQEFLRACQLGKDAFLKYVDKNLLSHKGSIIDGELVELKPEVPFTEKEFRHPPPSTQKIIWDRFKDMPKAMMYCFGFWGYVIINMIKGNHIEKPAYLASELNGDTQKGIYMIDKALKDKDKATKDQKIDSCVRRILRSMCNSAPRDKRIIFNDFYLGKAYWRWHWSQKMSEVQSVGLGFEQILEILDAGYYGKFSEKMHSGKSYIGSENVLGGLLLYLKQTGKKEMNQERLKKIIDKISYLSAWKGIEIQEPDLNRQEIDKIAEIVLKEEEAKKKEKEKISKNTEELPESKADA